MATTNGLEAKQKQWVHAALEDKVKSLARARSSYPEGSSMRAALEADIKEVQTILTMFI